MDEYMERVLRQLDEMNAKLNGRPPTRKRTREPAVEQKLEVV